MVTWGREEHKRGYVQAEAPVLSSSSKRFVGVPGRAGRFN